MTRNPTLHRDSMFKSGDLVWFFRNGRHFTALLLEDPDPPGCGNYPFSFKILCDEFDTGDARDLLHTERIGYPLSKIST